MGLIHTNGRLYDPALGRYLSPDAAVSHPGLSKSWNGYAYVSNSPLSYTDPTGMVQAGPGCNVGGVMCLESGGGGFAQTAVAYPSSVSVRVTIPYLRPVARPSFGASWGVGVPGEGGFGGPFGGLGGPSFGFELGFVSFDIQRTIDRLFSSDAQGPGDRRTPVFRSPLLGNAASIGVSFIPGVGTAQAGIEVATGYDYFTGERIDRRVALIGVIPFIGGALKAVVRGGRLGNAATRQHVREVAEALRRRGWDIIGGSGLPEEYIRSASGARRGSSYADITAQKEGKTLRINTVDTLVDGVTPSARERRNAQRMRENLRSRGEDAHVLLIPKPRP